MQQQPSPLPDNLTAIADYVSMSLLSILFFPVLLFTGELFGKMGGELKWELPAALIVAIPFLYLQRLDDRPAYVQLGAIALLLVAEIKAFTIAGLFYDDSSDSMAYHADAILQILKGVNPLYESLRGFDDIWVNHYPKATWYFASIIIHMTGNYNLGKCYNLLLMYGAFFYVFSVTKRLGLGTFSALLAALAASFSPVAISQMHTFYVDGALASLTTLAMFAALAMMTGSTTCDRLIFVMAGCLMINVKFTGAAYLFVIGGLSCASLLVQHIYLRHTENADKSHAFAWTHVGAERLQQFRVFTSYMMLIGLLGGAFMGLNPYITNTLSNGNPLYPLFGKGSTDVVAAQSPQSFNDNHTSTPERVVRSIFSKSENVIYQHGTAEPQWKIPFSIAADELKVFVYQDVRIAGWGVLFGGTLLIALVLYGVSCSWKNAAIATALGFIIFSVIINPGSWWARYAPQIALLPVFLSLSAAVSSHLWQRVIANFVFILMLLNVALIVPPNFEHAQEVTRNVNTQINSMLKTCGKGVYEMYGNDGYHFEQFFMGTGITLTYPKDQYYHQSIIGNQIQKVASKHAGRGAIKEDKVFPFETNMVLAHLEKKDCWVK